MTTEKTNRLVVLVIDDSTDFIWLVSLSLKDTYEVISALNISEAGRLCASIKIDLVISDFHFPSYTGLDVIRLLRSSGLDSGVPVIIYSSNPTARLEAIKNGFSFIDKMDLSKLKPLVDHQLSGGTYESHPY